MRATFRPPTPDVKEGEHTILDFIQLLEAYRLKLLAEDIDDTANRNTMGKPNTGRQTPTNSTT
jgi:chemotaxis receptor (MCP) glutamine deamidase CheD